MSLKSSIRQTIFSLYRLSYFFNFSYVRTRAEFPLILNRQGLTGEGVEVGIWMGDYSDFLLKKWEGKILYSVDPWKNFPTTEYDDDMNITQENFDMVYLGVCERLEKYNSRSVIMRKSSQQAAESFSNNSLDFVYLDGRHSYEGVKEDISLWYPKVKSAGILSGHDYLDGRIGHTEFGVKSAVDEFIREKNYKLKITHKDDFPSWFIQKK